MGNPLSLDGMNASGVRVVVSPQLPAGTLVLGSSRYLLFAEQAGAPVELKALEVGILGWEVGVYGMVSAAVTQAKAFVKIAAA